MKTRAICWILFFLSLASHAHASQHRTDCSKQGAIAAEKEAVKLDSVVSLYDSYKRFAHCDDGAIAEGYNESVVRILTQQWNRQLIELYRLTSRDERFRAFVLRHINEAMTLGSAVLGALGAWLLIRFRQRRPESRALYLKGMTLGAICGVFCLPVSLTIVRLPMTFFAGRWRELFVDLPELTTEGWPYVAAGLVAGVGLGWLVAVTVGHREATGTR